MCAFLTSICQKPSFLNAGAVDQSKEWYVIVHPTIPQPSAKFVFCVIENSVNHPEAVYWHPHGATVPLYRRERVRVAGGEKAMDDGVCGKASPGKFSAVGGTRFEVPGFFG